MQVGTCTVSLRRCLPDVLGLNGVNKKSRKRVLPFLYSSLTVVFLSDVITCAAEKAQLNKLKRLKQKVVENVLIQVFSIVLSPPLRILGSTSRPFMTVQLEQCCLIACGLSVFPSIYPSVYLSICMSVYISFSPPVYKESGITSLNSATTTARTLRIRLLPSALASHVRQTQSIALNDRLLYAEAEQINFRAPYLFRDIPPYSTILQDRTLTGSSVRVNFTVQLSNIQSQFSLRNPVHANNIQRSF